MKDVKSQCEMCGECCYYEIPLTLHDIYIIAKHLKKEDKEVFNECIQKKISPHSSLYMIQKKKDRACIFLTDDKKCSIHPARPRVCEFYNCVVKSNKSVLPWTSHYTQDSNRAKLWEQSVSTTVTKAYIEKNGIHWNSSDYYKAILSIRENTVDCENKKIKLSKDEDGTPIAMIYDCNKCKTRGECAHETIVTIDDINRIMSYLGISGEDFFRTKISPEISAHTEVFKLNRDCQCIFVNRDNRCSIEEVRPMHCRFIPCPQRVESNETVDCLYLGSGTIEEQFRHQVALSITRQYIGECGTSFNKEIFEKLLNMVEHIVSNNLELENFSRGIAPYRYVDDTRLILMDSKKRK